MEPSRLCPKCSEPLRGGATACARCGLSIFHWDTYRANAAAEVEDPVLSPLWQELGERWQDEEAHNRFIDAAVAASVLDLAAARYRAWLRLHGPDPLAEAALARAARYVERLHAVHAASERPQASARLLRGLSVFVALLLVGAVAWLLAIVLRR